MAGRVVESGGSGRVRLHAAVVATLLIALLFFRYGSLLANASTDFAHFEALHEQQLVNELADSRLNAWILSWVLHAGLDAPAQIYDANAFHPAPRALTGSEHLFGVALQVLPLRVLTSDAVALHQLALFLSAALLGWTSFLFVRWATASPWAGAIAAVAAVMMPWRVTELSHLQLSSVQLVPLIWMYILRGLLEGTRRRDLLWLGICSAIQLLSSFYVAYFLTATSLVLLLSVALLRRPAMSDLLRLAAAVLPGSVLFALSAIPYLERQAGADLSTGFVPTFSLGLGGAWGVLAPQWPGGTGGLNAAANYNVPYGVALLAFVAIAAAWIRHSSPVGAVHAGVLRRRAATLALAAISAFAFIMAIGGAIELAGLEVKLPAYWLSAVLPGFSLLRGPARWGIAIGVAFPLLAGLGWAALERRAGRQSRLTSQIAALVLLGASLDWFAIPSRPVWEEPTLIVRRQAVLRALPAGASLEVPWNSSLADSDNASRALLASTLDWRPLVNGYTGHLPATYRFLQGIGDRLPGAMALDQLRRLTGVRFIVIDRRRLPPREFARWSEAARRGALRIVHSDDATLIYEVVDDDASGSWTEALISPQPRAATFAGISRAPIAPNASRSALAVELNPVLRTGSKNPVIAHITNGSAVAWPGFDNQPEGLVQLRYTLWPLDGRGEPILDRARTRLAMLGSDIAAHTRTSTLAKLEPPPTAGTYRLCIDLVQQLSGTIHPLGLRSFDTEVEFGTPYDPTGLAALVALFSVAPPPLPACALAQEP